MTLESEVRFLEGVQNWGQKVWYSFELAEYWRTASCVSDEKSSLILPIIQNGSSVCPNISESSNLS